MKRLFLIASFLTISTCIFSQNSNATIVQQNNQEISSTLQNDSVTVAISPGTDNVQTISQLGNILKTFNGVTSSNYCSTHNIYVICFDPTIYTTNQAFYNSLKTFSNINSLLLKEGDVNNIIPFCGFNEAKPIQTLSAEKALLDK